MAHPGLVVLFSLIMLVMVNLMDEWADGKLFRKRKRYRRSRPWRYSKDRRSEPRDFR